MVDNGYEKRNTEKQGRGGSSAGGFDNCQGNFLYDFKLLLETMGQFTLLGLRSLLAFAVLLAISFKYLKATKKRRCYIRHTRRSLSFYSHVPGTFRP